MTISKHFFIYFDIYKLVLGNHVEKCYNNIQILVQNKLHTKMNFNTFHQITSYQICICKQISLTPCLYSKHTQNMLSSNSQSRGALVKPYFPLQSLTLDSIFCYTPAYCKHPNCRWVKSVHKQPGVRPHASGMWCSPVASKGKQDSHL